MTPEEVLDLARASGALLEGHFLLSSGLHSDRYVQCALLLRDPRRAASLAEALAPRLPERPDVVVGPAMGAVIWAHEMARALGVEALFTERADGAMALRRGFALEPGQRVLVVEDVCTTGKSAREALAVVTAAGATPIAVASIINRSGADEPFAAEGLPYRALAPVTATTHEPDACPLCADGTLGPAIKPGSRPQPA